MSDDHDNSSSSSGAQGPTDFRFIIDNSSVGGLIGKGGANVKRVRDDSGAHVSILKSENRSITERIMTIKGTTEQISKAALMLCELLIEARQQAAGENRLVSSTLPPDQAQLRMLVHKQAVGAIIGKAGAVIKETQNETQARIQVSNEPLPQSTEKTVAITGTPSSVEAAIGRIVQQLKDNPVKNPLRQHEYNPNAAAGGYQFQQPLPQAPVPMPLAASGAGMAPSTQKIAIPTVCAGCVIGKNGSVIRDLRAQSQTNISISDPEPNVPNERVVTLTGTAQGIQHAVFLIRQLVETYTPPRESPQQYQ